MTTSTLTPAQAASRLNRHARIALGQCFECPASTRPGETRCEKHAARARLLQQERYWAKKLGVQRKRTKIMPKLARAAAAAKARTAPLERDVLAAIRLALGAEKDLVLWRNHIAHDEQWNAATGAVTHARAGLPEGSADLIGILRMTVVIPGTFGVVPIGRLIAFEVKAARGRQSEKQKQWGALVQNKGGFYAVVRSPDEAMAALERARKGLPE